MISAVLAALAGLLHAAVVHAIVSPVWNKGHAELFLGIIDSNFVAEFSASSLYREDVLIIYPTPYKQSAQPLADIYERRSIDLRSPAIKELRRADGDRGNLGRPVIIRKIKIAGEVSSECSDVCIGKNVERRSGPIILPNDLNFPDYPVGSLNLLSFCFGSRYIGAQLPPFSFFNPALVHEITMMRRSRCAASDTVSILHRLSGLAGVFHRLPGKANLSPDEERTDARNGEGKYRRDEHPHGPIGHVLLRLQIPKLVWIGLGGLGLALCYGGFVWAGRLFDRGHDIASLIVAGSVIPLGGFFAAFAVAAWLSY